MIKESKNIDFHTTGRQPTNEDFAMISECIKKDKEVTKRPKRVTVKKKTVPAN